MSSVSYSSAHLASFEIMKYVSLLTLSLLFFVSSFAQNWTQQGSDIDGEAAGDESGRSVSLSSDGSTVAIGAPYSVNGTAAGHVRIYSLNSTNNIAVMPSKQVFYTYPNPCSNELNIKIESNLLGSKFRIINSLGQEIKQGELRSLSSAIDVSKLPKGNYIIQIGTENYSHQFLVE